MVICMLRLIVIQLSFTIVLNSFLQDRRTYSSVPVFTYPSQCPFIIYIFPGHHQLDDIIYIDEIWHILICHHVTLETSFLDSHLIKSVSSVSHLFFNEIASLSSPHNFFPSPKYKLELFFTLFLLYLNLKF